MAEAAVQTPPAAAAAPSSPSSPAAPSTPAVAAPAPAAASAPNPTPAASAEPPKRPTYAPEAAWDAVNGKVIEDKLAEHVGSLEAFKAAEDSRRLTIPTPDKYEIALPKDFKAPEGIAFELNKDDPIIAQARTLANKNGLGQEGFQEFLGLYAATKVGEQQQFKAAYDAEVSKLGSTATARVTAVQTWLTAMAGPEAAALNAVLAYAPKADTIVAIENLMKKFSSQGGASFSQSHREQAAPKITDEEYNKLSYSEKQAYAKRNKAA